MNEVILGIDPSLSSTGICILNDKGNIHTIQVIHHSLDDPQRLLYIYNYLVNIITSYKPTRIAYERQVPQMRYAYSAGSIIPLAELAGVLKLALLTTSVEHAYKVSPEDIKRYATSNPKATKEDMIAAISKRPSDRITRDIVSDSVNDVADAYHLSRLIWSLVKSPNHQLEISEFTYNLSSYITIGGNYENVEESGC